MARTVKHFSLHRIAGTELRVVADVETGVIPLIQVEEAVIRGYARQGLWPHQWVTFFVLKDLQPLIRQLAPPHPLSQWERGPGGESGASEGGGLDLSHRPVVNVYDLADPAGCHVFVNRQAMEEADYWNDPLAIQSLLAHEHAHPLAENGTTQSSRQLNLALSPQSDVLNLESSDVGLRTQSLLTLLADKLCLYAPREIFANEMTIRGGFGAALLYLDRRNVTNAAQSVAGRERLNRRLQQEVTRGNLTPSGADLLLLIGDLHSYLDLALEVAPFYRTGREADARELEGVLETTVFPHLEPVVARAYTALCELYRALRADLTPTELAPWCQAALYILAEVLRDKGLILQYQLRLADSRPTTNDE
jgi:hypothetical protein